MFLRKESCQGQCSARRDGSRFCAWNYLRSNFRCPSFDTDPLSRARSSSKGGVICKLLCLRQSGPRAAPGTDESNDLRTQGRELMSKSAEFLRPCQLRIMLITIDLQVWIDESAQCPPPTTTPNILGSETTNDLPKNPLLIVATLRQVFV